MTFNIREILTGYMLAVKISIKAKLSCSICKLLPVTTRNIAYFTKCLTIYMFRPI